MRRKRWILFGLAFLLLFAGAAGSLLWALLRVPDFYANAAAGVPARPEERQQAAKSLVQETTNLINNIKHTDAWSATFKQSEVNSWFAEELPQEKYSDIVPEGVSNPRLAIQDGFLQLGFRFRKSGWSGIVSLQLKPWIQKQNQLAIEIEGIRAGIVPIPLEDMLHELTRHLVEEGWKVTWTHANGNDVVLIDLSKQNPDAPVLEGLAVIEGEVRVQGRRKQPEGNANAEVQQSPRTAFNR